MILEGEMLMNQPLRVHDNEPLTLRQRRRSVGAGFMYFGIYFAVQNIVSTVYVFLFMLFGILQNSILNFDALLLQTMQNAVLLSGICNLLTLVVYWILFSARHCQFSAETHLTSFRVPFLLLMIPLGLSCYTCIVCILSQLPENLLLRYTSTAENLFGSFSSPLEMICLIVLAPLAEEVVFRGLFYTRLKRGMRRAPALLLTGIFFGLMHGQLIWSAYAFVLSILLCIVLDWYDSLWASILLHISFNAGQYVVAPFFDRIDFASLFIGSVLLLVLFILLAYRVGRHVQQRS